ncbi:MAG: hypothetical protein HOK06_05520 [Rhodospirillaceae bacterium]|jgi:hypothetical protein|nr:hypothetical protein [Rhodospirillaceae bacterium]MBT4219247.1 hypothetical protein [Rhodospirillaceae bacterium]MBT4463059.1 hypothetical protein [Rhodospirillaceae bacterium]MBT5014692.1 hypothetical protein [Rhodospirillaceae bacterium]MBT5308829.1 hypothetical protein [Rhodospirillaceae bacterium]
MNEHSARTVFIAALFAVFMHGTALAEGFFRDIDDLPLMKGLSESTTGSMIFDSGSGRIVESFAEGKVSSEAVLEFYASTLPQLGWQQDAPDTFRREGEILKLAFPGAATARGKDAPLTVRFTLSPAKN